MATFMTALVSELHHHARSDPEYFLPSHTQVEADLESVQTLPLRKLGQFSCSAFYPAATHLYTPEGIPFLRCVDIVNFPLMSPDQPFARIPDDFVNAHSTIRNLKAGDIVISKVGSPCYAALLSDDMPLSAMTRTVLGISNIDESIIDPYYLIAFLRSRHGFDQLMRERELTIQYQLTLERTRKIRVFLPERPIQKMVGDMVRGYYKCLRDSLCSYDAAQQLLESELGLDNLTFQKPVGYTARFSDIETSRRFDPEHYYPAFEAFTNSLPPGISLSPLNRHLTFCQRGQQPIYSAAGLRVINSKHVQPNRVLLEDNRFAAANPDGNLQIRAGDTLLNGTGRGTLGRAAPYLIDEPAVPDNHVTILRSDDLDPVYLSLFLNSAAGQMQVEMRQRGSSGQLELYPFDIRKFLVWPAPESLQQELRRLHDQAAAAERESRQLLEQAKSRVEQLIEEAARA
jgi:type I restriction enzyme M protein